MKRIFCAALAVSACVLTAFGDEWMTPKTLSVFSENGQYLVRIVPGDTTQNSGDPAVLQKGPYARGEFYARQRDRSYRLVADVALQNPVNPVAAAVTDKGRLITFDNWHHAGYGKVVAIYTDRGKLIRAYTLEELYSQAQIFELPLSASSRWWRCGPTGTFGEPNKISTGEYFGGRFTFDIEKATFQYHPGTAPCDALGYTQ
jgi:hypothetical protein